MPYQNIKCTMQINSRKPIVAQIITKIKVKRTQRLATFGLQRLVLFLTAYYSISAKRELMVFAKSKLIKMIQTPDLFIWFRSEPKHAYWWSKYTQRSDL